jgi:hypothetical protein
MDSALAPDGAPAILATPSRRSALGAAVPGDRSPSVTAKVYPAEMMVAW